MKIDVLTIFPEYLAPLELSLIGRAKESGQLGINVHDLRDWTSDPHRTVDDSPAGGGAGMVMKPDIWGLAIDTMLAASPAGRTVLAIPTPAGVQLNQRIVEDLAIADHLVIACGRYEGIDARVAEHYAGRVETLEYSLGDYVLNGGEVAALALVEAVARLQPGVIGNAESLVEESHGTGGLLEYPVYTRPTTWRGLQVPDVLLGGHHALIKRWRRSQAIMRTVNMRPDLLAQLDLEQLDAVDKHLLAQLGWIATPEGISPVRLRPGRPEDAESLSELACATFPMACPPELTETDIQAFMGLYLMPEHFANYLAAPERYLVMVAEVEQDQARPVLGGYSLSVIPNTAEEDPYAPDVALVVPQRPAAELSKIYVRGEFHSTGLAQALLTATLRTLGGVRVEGQPLAVVWLGTNARNRRAQRFYAKNGFAKVGSRRFLVGGREQDDSVWATAQLESDPEAVAN